MESFLTVGEVDVRSLVRIAVALASFALGFYVYYCNKQKASARYFAFTAFFIGLWVYFGAMIQIADDEGTFLNNALLWSYLSSLSAAFIPYFFLHFSLHVGSEHMTLSRRHKLMILVPSAVLVALALVPKLLIPRVVENAAGINVWHFTWVTQWVFMPVLSALLLANFLILIKKYQRGNELLRLRLRYILFGALVSISMAMIGNMTLPLMGVPSFIWLGSATAGVFVGTVSYALLRKQLWDFKLALSELVLFGVTLVLLSEVFIADSPERVAFKTMVLVLVILFGFYLIRSISREVEARRNVEELTKDLAGANRRLKEIDVEKSEFVSIASHQLRTPLTVIKGYASMMLEGSFGSIDNPKHKEIIRKIFEASQRLVIMIEDFLNISRIEEGKMSYSFGIIDLSKLAYDVIEEIKHANLEADVNISLHLREGEHMYVIGDDLKIRQVIINLIDNAVKYSPRGARIDLSLIRKQSSVVISVRDYGIGISSESLSRLFKKFTRTDESSKLHTEGRGLGLYIAQQIMMAHGGRIWAESEGRGKGSTFYLAFPEVAPDVKRREVKSFVGEIA